MSYLISDAPSTDDDDDDASNTSSSISTVEGEGDENDDLSDNEDDLSPPPNDLSNINETITGGMGGEEDSDFQLDDETFDIGEGEGEGEGFDQSELERGEGEVLEDVDPDDMEEDEDDEEEEGLELDYDEDMEMFGGRDGDMIHVEFPSWYMGWSKWEIISFKIRELDFEIHVHVH